MYVCVVLLFMVPGTSPTSIGSADLASALLSLAWLQTSQFENGSDALKLFSFPLKGNFPLLTTGSRCIMQQSVFSDTTDGQNPLHTSG